MTTTLSRRQLLVTSSFAIGALQVPNFALAGQNDPLGVWGGIGWPREQFEAKIGTGTESDGMVIYSNPYMEDSMNSRLAVVYEDGVATFIDVSLPPDYTDESALKSIATYFIQGGATETGHWMLKEVHESPKWMFTEYYSQELGRLGSGADRVMTTQAFNSDGLVRFTISLARPGNGSGFASADESVGVGDSLDEFTSVFGDPYEGHGATGHYDSSFAVQPWDDVTVFSHRDDELGARIDEVSAFSATGVSEEDAIVFANATLPQGATLRAGYGGFAVPNRNQGWGISSWLLADEVTQMIMFIPGAGDDSGKVLQVVTSAGTL